MKKTYSIPEFSAYINVEKPKNDQLHIVRYEDDNNILLSSTPISIDFYLLSVKTLPADNKLNPFQQEEKSASFLFLDCPGNTLEWDMQPPVTGYSIMVSPRYLGMHAKAYGFMHYDTHEALFLTQEEESIIWDLFKKIYNEFGKPSFSKEILVSYITLILSYTQEFYNRQFDTRTKAYHQLITDFRQNLEAYYSGSHEIPGLPSVAFFAQKAGLSPNYFGDLIKHFTGQSPIDHIHNFVVSLAEKKLKQTQLSISEISYSLGFDYPTYFARFFKKKTGISPRMYRSQ